MKNLYLNVKTSLLLREIRKALKFAGEENFVVIKNSKVYLKSINYVNKRLINNNYKIKKKKAIDFYRIKLLLRYNLTKFEEDKEYFLIKKEYDTWDIKELNGYKSILGNMIKKGSIKVKKKKKKNNNKCRRKRKYDIMELLDYI